MSAVNANAGLKAHSVGMRVGSCWLIRDIDLCLAPGEVGAVLGPNGAGKSTLLSVLGGLADPSAGQVTIDDEAVKAVAAHAWARRRAMLPQETAVAFDFSVRDVVALGRYPHHLAPSPDEDGIVAAAMAATDVAHLAARAVGHLSGGERLRVQLARVLAQIWSPLPDGCSRWLLLDEPTAALDLRHQHEILGLVRGWARERGVGVLLVLHDLNLALRYADRVWVMHGGRLAAQGRAEAVLTPACLAEVWGVRASAMRDAQGMVQLLVTPGPPDPEHRGEQKP